MKKEDIDIWKKSLSILTQIFVPAIASTLISDPNYAQGASTFVLQMLSLAQSEVKQKRVESLVFGLEELLKKHDPNFKFDEANVQEVRDLLETAIINASRATSEGKIERLRRVLIGHIMEPQPFDYTSRYLDLAVRLNDDQIQILDVYYHTENKLKPLREELSTIHKILKDSEKIEPKIFGSESKASEKVKKIYKEKKSLTEKTLEDLQFDFEKKINIRRHKNKEFEPEVFQFLFNDLRVLGLVYNPSEGRMSDTGDPAYYHCTALGIGFIKYLVG